MGQTAHSIREVSDLGIFFTDRFAFSLQLRYTEGRKLDQGGDGMRQEGVWLRGNLHMHTTRSDGRVSVEEAIARYERGELCEKAAEEAIASEGY